MKIPALKFLGTVPGNQPIKAELVLAKGTFDRTGWGDLPVAYVVQTKNLASLRPFSDLIVDRGIKHRAKGLSKVLLGQSKVPLIRGNFSAPGQLRRSIRSLLENAGKLKDRNLFVIGVEELIFQALWQQAGRISEEAGTGVIDPPTSISGSSPEGTNSSRVILDLMGFREEPPDLAKRYIGNSTEAKLVRQLILHAARVDDTALILGDTGTGKEVVARAIHDYSRRQSEKFTIVNCGGIPRELLESELFGHEKGAFTGAIRQKTGLWEVADKGTLFLDEIGDLPLEHQVKILRALQEGRIRRVGGEREIKVTARIIAATNRDLFAMVQAGQFREDLYYRLREFTIRTPSLRNIPEDVPLLAQFFWQKIIQDKAVSLAPEIISELQSHRWPGNAREVKTVLINLRGLFGVEHLRVEHLRAVFLLQGQTKVSLEQLTPLQEKSIHRMECLHHLHRLDEIIRASEVTLQPLVGDQKNEIKTVLPVQAILRYRLSELEMLSLHPLLFHSEAMFSEVYLLKGKLAYFQGLLQKDAEEALQYWRKEVAEELNKVKGKLSDAVNLLLSTTS
jgi:DNA-binding NtrC family response regulator